MTSPISPAATADRCSMCCRLEMLGAGLSRSSNTLVIPLQLLLALLFAHPPEYLPQEASPIRCLESKEMSFAYMERIPQHRRNPVQSDGGRASQDLSGQTSSWTLLLASCSGNLSNITCYTQSSSRFQALKQWRPS